jgi:hypothetical protein
MDLMDLKKYHTARSNIIQYEWFHDLFLVCSAISNRAWNGLAERLHFFFLGRQQKALPLPLTLRK